MCVVGRVWTETCKNKLAKLNTKGVIWYIGRPRETNPSQASARRGACAARTQVQTRAEQMTTAIREESDRPSCQERTWYIVCLKNGRNATARGNATGQLFVC